ncbi:hypothetical protein [Streptomyces sp. NPDC058872]|uniref:hypothetical protein n=1 Tax=Streptomyces sp. NPDC058872 TaxID=3346661 RepID=UPI0036A10BBA
MPRFKKAAVSLVVLGSLLSGAGTAVADGGSPSRETGRSGDGAEALCKRVPKIEKRIQRALERMSGDADERGSLARLEGRVAAAEEAGHAEVHTLLDHRLTARKALRTTLEQRQKDVAAVKGWCEANKNGSQN